jgi:hypothetical protein
MDRCLRSLRGRLAVLAALIATAITAIASPWPRANRLPVQGAWASW